MRLLSRLCLALACAILGAGQAPAMAQSAPTPQSAPALTEADLATYVDGFMPYALASGDIAGAEVVVVKDGRVLFERGYGYADLATRRKVDPKTTLFRPGSISKLFTWTAVMQQVEQGRIDLDADVNRYLDFRIPPRDGRPVTMRQLMTHTAGFEEVFKNIIVHDPRAMPSLEAFVKAWTPTRIYPPGQVVAYSNYGATLAGYIVQRVSGEPYEAYVAHHIFGPLGMTRSTMVQDPSRLHDLSSGYSAASAGARPFEYIGDAPAGALSASGEDMGRFMLAHLGQGPAILRPQIEALMQGPAYLPAPRMNSMALGFYGEDRNGRRIVGHAGDLINFHADLHLMPRENVGLYVALNSWGRNNASTRVREALFRGFVDRYFPQVLPQEPTWPTAVADGRRLVGAYEGSRQAADTFASLATLLGQGTMTQAADGTRGFSRFLDAGDKPKRWREIAPFVWREVGGRALMSAVIRDGRVDRIATNDIPPVAVWRPAARNAAWVLPLIVGAFVVLLVTVALWPVVAVVRWRYGRRFAPVGWPAWTHRLSRAAAVADLAFLAGWLVVVLRATGEPSILSPALDPWLRLIQLFGVAGAVLGVFAACNLVVVWRDRPRRWWSCIGNGLLVAACLATLWLALSFHLLSVSLHY